MSPRLRWSRGWLGRAGEESRRLVGRRRGVPVALQRRGESDRLDGVGGDAAGGREQTAGSVAQAPVGERVQLSWVVEARGEGGFGALLAEAVVQRAAGELEGSGDTRRPVAPGWPKVFSLAAWTVSGDVQRPAYRHDLADLRGGDAHAFAERVGPGDPHACRVELCDHSAGVLGLWPR